MIRRDYILRMLDDLGKVLARLTGLRTEGMYDDGLELIDEIYRSYFSFDSQFLRFTEPDKLIEVLKEQEHLEEPHFEVMAELLHEESRFWEDQGNWPEAVRCLRQALNILRYLNVLQPDLYSIDRQRKMEDWEDRLG